MTGEGVTSGLRSLLGRLQTYRVDWSVVSGKRAARDEIVYEEGIAIEESDLNLANVASSLLKPNEVEEFLGVQNGPRHVIALDIDIPAHLVASSTPGHSHLYIEVKDGVPHHRYMALLSALADAGVIERGYADISIKRGRSDLRLPWVAKGDPLPPKPEAFDPAAIPALVAEIPLDLLHPPQDQIDVIIDNANPQED